MPQIDNTAVKRTLHPEDYPDLIGPPAPKRHDTGYITQDYSNPFQRAAQKWSSAYLNSSFANSPFMDVMRWIPGLNYVEKILTAQPVSEEESMGFMTPVKIGKTPSIQYSKFFNGSPKQYPRNRYPKIKIEEVKCEEPLQKLIDDINTGRKEAVNFLKSDAVKGSEAHNVALAKRAGFGDIYTDDRAAAASVPMKKQNLSEIDSLWEAPDNFFWVGKPDDGFYLRLQKYSPAEGSVLRTTLEFPEKDIMVMNPFLRPNSNPWNGKATGFHETLHRGEYGDIGRAVDFYKKYNANTASPDEIHAFSTKVAPSYNFYTWKKSKLINPSAHESSSLTTKYLKYIQSNEEAAVHLAEMGYAAGLKPGQPYPGKTKALEILSNLANKDRRLYIFNWQNKPKRVWDALTGKYFALPIIGLGGGAAAVSATQKQEEQQTQ